MDLLKGIAVTGFALFLLLGYGEARKSAGNWEQEQSASSTIPWYIVYWKYLFLGIGLVVGLVGFLTLKWKARVVRSRTPPRAIESLEEHLVPDITPAITRILESAPILPFSEIGEDRDTRCPICLEEFTQEDRIVSLPECNHLFRVDCLRRFWVSGQRTTCPSCRRNYLTID